MFAMASSASGLKNVSNKGLALLEILRDLVTSGEASNVEGAAEILIRWATRQLAAQEAKPVGPVFDLLQRVAADPVPAIAEQILSAAGVQSVLAQLVDLQDEWLGGDGVPFLFRVSDGQPVLVRLMDLAGTTPVRVAIEADAGHTLGTEDGLKLALNAEASAAIEIQVPTPASLTERFGLASFGPVRTPVALVASGEFGAGADWSLGVAGFSAGANFSRGLAAVYDFPSEHSSIRALSALFKNIPDRLDPAAIHRAFAVPGEDGMKLIQIDRARGFTFSLGYEKGVSLVDVRTIGVDGKKWPITSNAGATLKLGITHQESQQRQLRINRDPGGGLKLSSSLVDRTETGASIGLDAGITITGWGDVAKALVDSHLPDAEKLLTKLGPMAAPGQWLRDALSEALKNLPKELSPIIGLLTGELDAKSAQTALVSQIQDLLNSKVSLWSSVLEDRLDHLIKSLVEHLAPRASLMPFRPQLTKSLADALKAASLIQKARGTLRSHIPNGKAQLEDLTKLLGGVGIQVEKVATKADQLVEPVLRFLKDHDAFRQKLIASTEKIAKIRLGIAIEYARKDAASDSVETAFLIPQHALESPATTADFRAWVTGGHFLDPARPFGAPVADDAWKIVSTRTSEATTSVRLDLALGDATTVDLLKSETRVEVGPGGVLVALTRASAKKLAKNSWSDEVVTASGATILDVLSPHLPMSALSMDLEFEDNEFQEKELASLLKSLDRLGHTSFPTALSDRLWNEWEVVRQRQGAKAPKARLRLGLMIDEAGRSRLLELAINPHERRTALANALLHATGERPERDVRGALKVLGYDADPATAIVRDWDRFAGWLKFKGPKKTGQIIAKEKLPVAASISSPVSRAVAAMWGAFDVVNAIESVLKTAAEWPRGNAEYEKSVKAHLDANASLKRYEAAFLTSKQIADSFTNKGKTTARALGRALGAADVMFEMNNGAPVNTLILMSFLSMACGTSITGEVANVP